MAKSVRRATDNFFLSVQMQVRALRSGPAALPELWAEQSRTLATTCYLFAALGVNSVGLFLLEFRDRIGAVGYILGGLMVALYVYWVRLALNTRTNRGHLRFLRHSIVILIIDGTLWGALVCHLSYVADEGRRAIVTAIMMCLVSVPMLGAPFSAAMAFWVPMVCAVAIAVGFQLQPFDFYMTICIISYTLFTFGGIVAINKTLLERSIGRVRLQQQNETISLLLRDYEANTNDCLWETDAALIMTRMPARLASAGPQLTGPAGVASFEEVFQLDKSDTPERQELIDLLGRRAAFRDLTLPVKTDDEIRWWCLSGRPILDDWTRFCGYKGVASDVTDAKRSEQRVGHLASHDSLTSLWNRQTFVEQLQRLCDEQSPFDPPRHFCVLLLDLDRFKEANDTYGHAVGDSLLVIVAERLLNAVRIGDVVARLGGDEFAVLLPEAETEAAFEVAARVSAMIANEFRIGDVRVNLGASFGIAVYPQDGTSPHELLRNVDLALYAAKKEERGSCRIYASSMGETFKSQLALQADLRTALTNGEFTLAYQPIYDLQTGKVTTAEALLRWDHRIHGKVGPATFVKMAEEMGLIDRLGQFALTQACREATKWSPSVRLAVNVSPLQCDNPNLVSTVMNALSQSGLPPSRLELELTESTWLTATAQTTGRLAALESEGIRIVLDDFGTGYSSLSCLREFRFDGLKLDGSFVKDIGQPGKSLSIVRMMVELAADIGVTLTAEGVETEEQLVILRSYGIKQGQGFYLGRPMSILETMTGFTKELAKPEDTGLFIMPPAKRAPSDRV